MEEVDCVNANLLWTIYKVMFEFILIFAMTYMIGNLSTVALGAKVLSTFEFYLIWGLVIFTFTL